MAIETTTGTSVPFQSNQRVDQPAAEAMQTDGQDTMVRLLGGVLGNTAIGYPMGCFEAPTLSYSTTSKAVTLTTPAAFLESGTIGDTIAPGSRVFRYTPGVAGQVTSISLAAYAVGATKCILWARRYEQAADNAAIVVWDNGAEVAQTGPTLTNELCAFTTGACTLSGSTIATFTTPPTPTAGQWVPFAVVTAWTGSYPTNTPTFQCISAWDGTNALSYYGATKTNCNIETTQGSAFSLWQQLLYIRSALATIQAQDGTVNWALSAITAPYRGLKELDADLTTAETDITTLQGNVTDLQTRSWYSTMVSFYVYDPGGSAWTPNSFYRLGGMLYATGTFSFSTSAGVMAASGGEFLTITSVQVTLRDTGAPSTALSWTVELTNAATATWVIRFYDSTTLVLTDPDATGFFVTVTALCGAL